MTNVKSSMLKSIDYDESKKELIVTFKSGKRYLYSDVTSDEYIGLMEADSVGKSLLETINPNHKTKLLGAKDEEGGHNDCS